MLLEGEGAGGEGGKGGWGAMGGGGTRGIKGEGFRVEIQVFPLFGVDGSSRALV